MSPEETVVEKQVVEEAVPPVTEETGQEEAVEKEVSTAQEEESVETKAEPKGVQKRIDELTWQREQAKRDAEYWKSKALEQKPPEAPVPQKTKPTLESCGFDNDKFVEELSAWKAKEAIREYESEKERAQVNKKIKDYFEKGKVKYDDFEEVVKDVPVSQPMVEILQNSEVMDDMAYYLGKHPDEARKIASMSPMAAIREMLKIEGKISMKPKQTSKAPEPITPIISGSGSTKETELSNEEWVRMQNEKEFGKRKR